MSKILNHRGPDDEGYLFYNRNHVEIYGGYDTPSNVYSSNFEYTPILHIDEFDAQKFSNNSDQFVILCQRRLSIIDVSASGHQPLSFLNGQYWIIFNGEIYNFIEIKNKLESIGYKFISNSDTEVILAAYDYWGSACLNEFNGMFAFVILDTKLNEIFIARDRFGVKPLYYRINNGRLDFASEIKAFTVLENWESIANRDRVLDFLIWNISDHTNQTMFKDVYQLPAGHFLKFNLEKLDLTIKSTKWYDIEKIIKNKSIKNSKNDLKKILIDSVRLRLRSDVTVGSCLSGGLDSSSIVSIMGQIIEKESNNFKTFTAKSDNNKFDESAYSLIVSKHVGASPNFVTPSATKLFLELDKIIWHQDEPFISTSIFAQWCVFELAKNNKTKVILDGQGADEILCGYHGFFGAFLAEKIRTFKIFGWIKSLFQIKKKSNISIYKQIGYTIVYLFPSLIRILGRFSDKSFSYDNWLNKKIKLSKIVDPVKKYGGRSSSVEQMSISQLTRTNLPMLLKYEDRNSMAFSVEARLPFLDYRFVEESLSLDSSLKIGNGITKEILRKEMINVVPDEILQRKDKMGFLTAEPIWMQKEFVAEFKKLLYESSRQIEEFVSVDQIAKDFEDMINNKSNFKNHYWRIICLANWARIYKIKKFS